MNRGIAVEIPNPVAGTTLVAIAYRHDDRAGRVYAEAGAWRMGAVATVADLERAISAGHSPRAA
jgi:hypothetical protein